MAENQPHSIYSKTKEYLVIIGIFIGIPIVWLLAAGLIYSSLTYFIVFDADKDIWAVRGTFRDSFGAVNGLFTGLAFCWYFICHSITKKRFRRTTKSKWKASKRNHWADQGNCWTN